MAIEQEFADLYWPTVDDFMEYLPGIDCGNCGYSSCTDYADALVNRTAEKACPECEGRIQELLLSITKFHVDPLPFNVMMEETKCEVIPINSPEEDSPLVVTCNFIETVKILVDLLISTRTKSYVLPTFTHGYSVDNAVHEKMFKALEIWKAIQDNGVEKMLNHRVMIIPGLAEKEKNNIRQLTRWDVEVGPVSGFLLPLYLETRKVR